MSTDTAIPVISAGNLQARFQTGIAYNTLGAVFNQGSTFAVNIIVANLLGRRIFGEYAMIQSTLATLALIAQFAAGYTATKYVAEFRSTNPQRAGRIIGMLFAFSASLAGIAALALFAISGWLAGSVLKAPGIGSALAIGSGVLLFAVLNGLLMGVLAGLESYRALARALVGSGLAYLFVCSGLAWWGGLNGAVAGLAVSGLLQFILLAGAVRKECSLQGISIRYAGITQERSILLRFALPGALSGFTTMPALWLASTFLVRQPNGYSQMAIYSASFSLMTAVLFLPNIANNVGMSLINHHKGAGRESEYQWTFWVNLAVSGAIVILGTCFLALLGPTLLRLFGKDFTDGYPVLLILLLATIVQGLAAAMYQVIQSQSRMWLSFLVVALPRDMLVVVLAYLLIPAHGARGFAWAYAASWTIALLAIASIVFRIGLKSNA